MMSESYHRLIQTKGKQAGTLLEINQFLVLLLKMQVGLKMFLIFQE